MLNYTTGWLLLKLYLRFITSPPPSLEYLDKPEKQASGHFLGSEVFLRSTMIRSHMLMWRCNSVDFYFLVRGR